MVSEGKNSFVEIISRLDTVNLVMNFTKVKKKAEMRIKIHSAGFLDLSSKMAGTRVRHMMLNGIIPSLI